MLDVNSGTSSLLGPERGQPDTHSAPTTAPDRLPSPPITDDRDQPEESSTRKNRSDGPNVRFTAPRSTPPSPAMNPPIANAMQLGARRRHRHRRRRELVLAHADDHAADAGALEVPDEQQHDDEHEQHEVVVRAVPVGELERTDVGARDLRWSRTPAVKNGRLKR